MARRITIPMRDCSLSGESYESMPMKIPNIVSKIPITMNFIYLKKMFHI